ncbi:hypothetical protein FHG64_11500 [Antarcticibacterium flavum]|uniref:Uncharacterized protein n=1 Tax=Antarcticibacterium flavum TaxID=2058175 RepID=A0A5B7X5Q2_9FLAO|nr:hypothetical protein [Antarcticibacterium flavum]MCM4159384.1 hypothetical protein [Antarcticibacterium sp. W02-3]QCY69973.1 hypothetical protein FHG64_11500 [Antarcticibacterium flavum]
MKPGISVPVQMFIDAQQHQYSRKLKLFIALKLLYKNGKAKLDDNELLFIELVEEIRCRKTTLKYLQFLLDKGWIDYNSKTGYYILKSFDRIRGEMGWKVRMAFPVDFYTYGNIRAVTGAVIYGYLHKDFWRKVRRKKSVQIKGSTYHFLSPNYNPFEAKAPISVLGINKIFQISPSTASRLKNKAGDHQLLSIQKNFSDIIPHKKAMELCLKYNDMRNNLICREGKTRLQLIDTVLPLFLFSKRKKLKA